MRPVLSLGIALVGLAGPAAAAQITTSPSHGVDLLGMDKSVRPGNDFFDYANGAWVKTTEIPADQAAWGVFQVLNEEAIGRTRDLIETTDQGHPAAGSEPRKVADFYAAFMDEAGIEAKGLAPLKPELDTIARVADKKALARLFGQQLRADVDPLNNTNFYTENLFGLWVAPGFQNPDKEMPYLLQGGLGMPDRDFYLADNPKMAELRTQYQAYVAGLLTLAGVTEPEAKAKRIYELELSIAQAHVSRTDSEDVLKANNPWAKGDFAKKAPGLDWAAYFAGAGLSAQPEFIVWHPGAMTGIAQLVDSVPLATWKEYLTFHRINAYAGVLPKAFVDARFDFYGKKMSGTPKLRERWKRAVADTNGALPDAVGQLYVAKYFTPEAKAKAQAMVADIIAAFGARIDKLDWMAPQTKAKAKEKVASLYVGIGYPEKWRSYAKLRVVRGDAFGNAQRAELFDYQYRVGKIGHAADRHEWSMEPQTVNAVNLPLQNALNFPAAILQPPFFDPDAELADNYGAIGAVIGHEISHSFDDQGCMFDAKGKLSNWWTPEDLAHFKASAAKLVAQYNAYHPLPDQAVNGQLTLSENIADLAGLAASHDAWVARLGGAPAPKRGNLDGEQQFFLSFAQSWRQKIREPALRQRLLTDGHAPDTCRADTVRNLDAWYTAFGAKAGEQLYLAPAERVRVW